MIEYQRIILADSLRNEAFARALKKVVRKGMTIADLGSGTGFLSFLASRLGAKECHLYECSELLDLSRSIAQENGITHCHFIRKHSTEVRTPVKADVVVSETLGNFALEEGIIETMNDASRFLKPGGTVIPQSLQQYISPMTSDRLWKEVTSWDRVGTGLTLRLRSGSAQMRERSSRPCLTFAAARSVSCNNIYVRTVRPADLLKGSVQEWDRVDFRKRNDPVRSARVTWRIPAATTVYGFAVFWECTLLPGITLSTAPTSPRTHWEQIFMPVLEPVSLAKGDNLELRLSVDSHQEIRINVMWDITVRSAAPIRLLASARRSGRPERSRRAGTERERQHLDMCRGYVE